MVSGVCTCLALLLAVGDPESDMRAAQALLNDGEVGAAVRLLEKVSRTEGVDPQVWSQLGYAYALSGNNQKSLQSLERAARVPDQRSLAFFNRACVLVREGRMDEALGSLDHAMAAETLPYQQILADPDLAPLRAMSDFPTPFETDLLSVVHDGRRSQFQLVLPREFRVGRSYPVLVALGPGDGGEASVQWGIRYFWGSPAARRRWVVVAPSTPLESWFSEAGRSLFSALVDAVSDRVHVERGQVHLAGCSSGGVAAVSLAIAFPDRIRSLTLLPGAPRTEREFQRLGVLKDLVVTNFIGADDHVWWRRQGTRMHEELLCRGCDSRLRLLAGDGHVMSSLYGGELMIYLDALRWERTR